MFHIPAQHALPGQEPGQIVNPPQYLTAEERKEIHDNVEFFSCLAHGQPNVEGDGGED